MKIVNQILALFASLFVLILVWVSLEVIVIGPMMASSLDVASKREEYEALLRRGRESIEILKSTKAYPRLAAPEGSESRSVSLQEDLNKFTVQSGGTVVSSQSGASGEVLIRSRFDEPGLLAFTSSVEAVTSGYRFKTFEVQSVPTGQGGSSLEMTALVIPRVSDAY